MRTYGNQVFCIFFFNDTATTEIYTLSLHDALPISLAGIDPRRSLPKVTRKTFSKRFPSLPPGEGPTRVALFNDTWNEYQRPDRKSTRLNSSHANISYAVFCLKKKAIHNTPQLHRRQ